MNEELARAESAFLRSASEDPIKWHLWNEENLQRARAEGKPVLLDIGASWCHWCHVMDEETYRDPEVVKTVNEKFFPIKVDRDEMPDLDSIMQQLVSSITGESGWPLTVFMTPDKRVFFGGTYFPAEDSMGRPGMRRVLREVLKLWESRKGAVEGISPEEVMNRLIQGIRGVQKEKLDYRLVEDAVVFISGAYDWEYGGIMGAMKFPHPLVDRLLLAHWFRTGDDSSRRQALFTLKSMYLGGIMDQVGGGFHRYTTDREWWIPHFEKLLIDNGEILRTYLDGLNATGDPELKDALFLTIDFVRRDLFRGDGFANSIDADSEGVEGKYYTWTKEEVKEVFGDRSEPVLRTFGFYVAGGEVEGRKVLKRFYDNEKIRVKLNLDPEGFLREVRERALKSRSSRIPPSVDWNQYSHPNFLMGESLVLCSGLVQTDSLWRPLADSIGERVSRRVRGGKEGLIEDYASAVNFLAVVYGVTGEQKYLGRALSLGKKLIEMDNSVFRTMDTPNESQASLVSRALLTLSVIRPTEFPRDEVLEYVSKFVRAPDEGSVFNAGLFMTVDALSRGTAHIVIVDRGRGISKLLLKSALNSYHPFKVIEFTDGEEVDDPMVREMVRSSIQDTAFICGRNSCSPPTSAPEKIPEVLRGFH